MMEEKIMDMCGTRGGLVLDEFKKWWVCDHESRIKVRETVFFKSEKKPLEEKARIISIAFIVSFRKLGNLYPGEVPRVPNAYELEQTKKLRDKRSLHDTVHGVMRYLTPKYYVDIVFMYWVRCHMLRPGAKVTVQRAMDAVMDSDDEKLKEMLRSDDITLACRVLERLIRQCVDRKSWSDVVVKEFMSTMHVKYGVDFDKATEEFLWNKVDQVCLAAL